MDESDTYYTALILDPRVNGDLIVGELEDKEAGNLILKAIRDNLHLQYPLTESESPGSRISQRSIPDMKRSNVESGMLQRLQPQTLPLSSDIDRYFDSPRGSVIDTTDPNWLCNWWLIHKDELLQMAAAARDFLAIPASEVGVERLFNAAWDLLGISGY
ncbi:hypothetical protein V1527DRAFT_477026 [Lipomyces starkeyi]